MVWGAVGCMGAMPVVPVFAMCRCKFACKYAGAKCKVAIRFCKVCCKDHRAGGRSEFYWQPNLER